MFAHFTKMAFKAFLRFKLHSLISLVSLVFGFVCFIAASLLSNYSRSFDQHFPNADRTYNVIQNYTNDEIGLDVSPIMHKPAAAFLRAEFPEIPYIVRTRSNGTEVTIDGLTETMNVRFVEADFLEIFPMELFTGFADSSSLPANSALIFEDAAIRRFGSTEVIGQRILLDNQADVSIVGVIKDFEQPSHIQSSLALFSTELIVPMEVSDNIEESRSAAFYSDPTADQWGSQSYYVYLQFPADSEIDEAAFNLRLDAFVKRNIPDSWSDDMTYMLQPINKLITSQIAFVTGGFDITSVLIVAGALVLLIGCLNYSNLVIAQLALRSQEISIQKILGAKRGMLIIQYCYESLLFVSLALLLSLLGFFGVLGAMDRAGLIGVDPSMLTKPSLWAVLGASMVVIVAIAGVYPALRTASVDLLSMMRPKGSGGYSGRLRATMVGMQFFISGTLMILAIVMYQQNVAMTLQLDGEVADPKIAITLPLDSLPVDAELIATELRQHAGVLSVTQIAQLPWSIGLSTARLSRSADHNSISVELMNHAIGHDFFETMEVPLLSGRIFSRDRTNDVYPLNATSLENGGPYSVIIDVMTAASLGWEDAEDAVGQTVYRFLRPPAVPVATSLQMTIIGIAGEQKFKLIDWTSLGVGGNSFMLIPPLANYMIVKASKQNIGDTLAHIDAVWQRLMPQVALKREFADDLFYDTYELFLSISMSIAALSVFGFLIASIGLLGNATFITNIRQKEVGIRKVMGASSGRLLRMLLFDFAKPIMIANAIAWPLAYVMASGYVSLFAASSPVTFVPFLISFLLSVLIATIAVVSQSWKSSHIRPAAILRYE